VENSIEAPPKPKIKLPYDQEIPNLGIYQKRL
jgi:hypothetical protein